MQEVYVPSLRADGKQQYIYGRRLYTLNRLSGGAYGIRWTARRIRSATEADESNVSFLCLVGFLDAKATDCKARRKNRQAPRFLPEGSSVFHAALGCLGSLDSPQLMMSSERYRQRCKTAFLYYPSIKRTIDNNRGGVLL